MSSNGEFVVCSFNDCHLSVLTDLEESFAYYEKCLYAKGKKADLLVLNGDIFMTADKNIVDRFFSWLDSIDIPFAFTYGNHDLQGHYSRYYIDSVIKKSKNSMVSNPLDDDVYGDCNYAINLLNSSNKVSWQLYFFDSNNYAGKKYDHIHDDQVEWYEKMVNDNTSLNGALSPSLTWFHIPFEEFNEAWEIKGKKNYGYDDEANKSGAYIMMEGKVSSSSEESLLFEKMQELGANKGVVVGHDHINNTDWSYTKDNSKEPIRLIYAEKTGKSTIYYDEYMMGCTYFTFKDGETTFKMDRYHLGYGDDSPTLISDEDLYQYGQKVYG